ncbi:copper resistance CopC family protein [Corynebacterium sanguinis]|uniref:Copper resistance protein CopC n=1 Tax=Corynebacterium sanguinis TaxID=2594913 RepID=A0A6C1TZY9_9CORY|nr:copper resistance CopC family protein [Corynebacterium sanguinis]MCT1463467.1 copper resistance protein CopC [Corynebacterium sanguinis]MCT1663734.1 copper resistance protein CopC [Corynebacterium sanguinis]MCT2153366.1 copper resistance protein CopC [Corynebacterium sanguinis]MCT2329120.1 copper resistance protein CopC [Corynebacterium sanguinis]TVS29654.1 copper resistance protein CopC [Corynebacterium sanguinis]
MTTWSEHSLRRGILAAGAALTIAAAPVMPTGLTPPAIAHDAVVGGSPANGEVVSEFPDTLTLDFSAEVQDGFNTFALSRTDTGEVVFTGEPTIDGRAVSVDLPADFAAEPGQYQIGYQIISSDGHATKGMTTFTYEPAAGAATSTAPAAQAGEPADTATQETVEPASNNMTLLWVGLGILAVLAIIAVAITRSRAPKPAPETPAQDTAN